MKRLGRYVVSMLLIFSVIIGISCPVFAYPQTNSQYLNSYNMHVLTNVISGVESYGQIYSDNRRYDAYARKAENTSNEKTCTLGWAQNYGNEGRKLVQMIYKADTDGFRKLDTCSPSIESMLQKDWVSIGWSPSSSQKSVLIKLITTEIGKNCQDELFAELMEKYLSNAVAYGVPKTNIKALMMWCEIAHLGGTSAAKRIFNRCSGNYSVSNIMSALKKDQSDTSSSNQVGDTLFWSRHLCCQSWINAYADDGNTKEQAQDKTQDAEKIITREVFVEAVRSVYEEAHDGKYKYGNSHAIPPTTDKIISCDRLIAKAVWDLGFTNQPLSTTTTSGLIVGDMDKYLVSYGFVKSTNISDIKYGSVVTTDDGNGHLKHTFVAVSGLYDGMIVKFDMGSQRRIDASQPFFEKWSGSDFVACYNIPDGGIKRATDLVKSGQNCLNKYFNSGIAEDGSYGSDTSKAYVKALQTVLNDDYGYSLDVDGVLGNDTYKALSKYTFGKDTKGRLVTLLEIGLMLNGYNPNGVEEIGNFGDGLLKAVNEFKKDKNLTVNDLAGAMTFKALVY